jgi:predicted nuclease of predicted toxin-antitoxin system
VRFFLDHDVPVEVARVLRHEGYEVTELREVLAVRASDVEFFNYACEHGLMLITCHRDDFLSLAAQQSNLVSLSSFVAGVGTLNADICWHCSSALANLGLIRNVNFA